MYEGIAFLKLEPDPYPYPELAGNWIRNHWTFLTHLLQQTFLRPLLHEGSEPEVRLSKRPGVFDLSASPLAARRPREISAENTVLERITKFNTKYALVFLVI